MNNESKFTFSCTQKTSNSSESELERTNQELENKKSELESCINQIQVQKRHLNDILGLKDKVMEEIIANNKMVSKKNDIIKYVFIVLLVGIVCGAMWGVFNSYFKYDNKRYEKIEEIVDRLEKEIKKLPQAK